MASAVTKNLKARISRIPFLSRDLADPAEPEPESDSLQLAVVTLGFGRGMNISGFANPRSPIAIFWNGFMPYLRYVLDPFKLKEFELYGKMWIPLVEKFGGKHHGYFMPSEGMSNIALALFTFPSLAEYESYRTRAATDAECQAAMRYYEETRCFISYERSFFRPVFR
jgi:hypothetical protein